MGKKRPTRRSLTANYLMKSLTCLNCVPNIKNHNIYSIKWYTDQLILKFPLHFGFLLVFILVVRPYSIRLCDTLEQENFVTFFLFCSIKLL